MITHELTDIGQAELIAPILTTGAKLFAERKMKRRDEKALIPTPAYSPPPVLPPKESAFPTWGYFAIGGGVLLLGILAIILFKK